MTFSLSGGALKKRRKCDSRENPGCVSASFPWSDGSTGRTRTGAPSRSVTATGRVFAASRWRAVRPIRSATPGTSSNAVKVRASPTYPVRRPFATTVAERGAPRSTLSSPTMEPGAIVPTRCCPLPSSRLTAASPETTRRNELAASPWRASTAPSGSSTAVSIEARVARRLASEPASNCRLERSSTTEEAATASVQRERRLARGAGISAWVSIRPPPVRRGGELAGQGGAMRYALLICADETAIQAMSPEEGQATLNEYLAFGDEMGKRGVLQGGERLRPTTDATTVRVRDGEVLTADGPFAFTKEQMGGFYLVDCKDLDEAIDVASKIPGARIGTIEVRPIWEM